MLKEFLEPMVNVLLVGAKTVDAESHASDQAVEALQWGGMSVGG